MLRSRQTSKDTKSMKCRQDLLCENEQRVLQRVTGGGLGLEEQTGRAISGQQQFKYGARWKSWNIGYALVGWRECTR